MSNREPSQPASNSRIDWEHICTNCRRGFNTSMAHHVVVVNESEAELMCSWCKDVDLYQTTDIDGIERPPAITDYTTETDEQGLSIARIFFDGGAWVQYRETVEGRVREEVFTNDNEQIESSNAEIEYDGCDLAELYDSPETYFSRAINEYEKFTVRGLEIQKPHIAAAVIERD